VERIDRLLLDRVTDLAANSSRGRKNHNFHKDYSDPLQRMLNAVEPWSYIRPHKHENPDKTEAFIILKGRMLILEFGPEGTLTGSVILDPSEGIYGAEIPPCTFHTIIALEPGTVVYEIKNGPYTPINDKNWAPWAPAEGSEEVTQYLKEVLAMAGVDDYPERCADFAS
jgi:cupin fold WbuC family metalloprotein